MRSPYLLLFLVVLSGFLTAQSRDSSTKIGDSEIWQVSQQFLSAAHSACDKPSHSPDIKCLLGQMTTAGAPAKAVAFTRELYKQTHGEFGIITGFHDEGPLAFAWVTYPLRANTNYGLLLVNGRPPIVNVEDLNLLDKKTMEQSAQFRDLKSQFPNVDLWPGDRDGKIWPNSQTGPNAVIQFTVGYPLLNGCHACERVGLAIFNWNFDAQGKFLGTTFVGLTASPSQ